MSVKGGRLGFPERQRAPSRHRWPYLRAPSSVRAFGWSGVDERFNERLSSSALVRFPPDRGGMFYRGELCISSPDSVVSGCGVGERRIDPEPCLLLIDPLHEEPFATSRLAGDRRNVATWNAERLRHCPLKRFVGLASRRRGCNRHLESVAVAAYHPGAAGMKQGIDVDIDPTVASLDHVSCRSHRTGPSRQVERAAGPDGGHAAGVVVEIDIYIAAYQFRRLATGPHQWWCGRRRSDHHHRHRGLWR